MHFLNDLQGPVLSAVVISIAGREFLLAATVIKTSSLYITGGVLFGAIELSLVTVLMAVSKRARKTRRLLDRRFAIEAAISRCSVRLSACPADRVDAEIEEGLRAIVKSEQIDRALWFVLGPGPADHVYTAEQDTAPQPLPYRGTELPWVTAKMMRAEPVVLGTLDELPAEAQTDKLHLARLSVQSAAFIPCGLGSGVQGVLMLVRKAHQLSWPAALIDRLCVLGNLFANALMRKQAQQAGVESEKRFRYVFEEAPIGIAIENVDGKILFANPTLCSILGYSVNELVGMNCCQFSDAEAEENDWDQFQRLREGLADTYRMDKRYIRKDGSRIWGRVNVTFLRGSGNQEPVVVATVEDISAAKKASAELSQLNHELHQLTTRLIQSQEVERQRIARELHDDISQRLALVMMDIDAWQGEIPFQRTTDHAALRHVMAQLDELSTDVHNLSHRLHSNKLQHLGLPAAVRELCEQFSTRHGLAIEMQEENVPRVLPELVSLCFYRVAQEALKNAVKHSGSSRIAVKIRKDGTTLRMHIQDFGVGFDTGSPSSAGLGLMTMQERLRMVGGALTINSAPENGTEVVAEAHVEPCSMAARVA